MKYYNVVLTSIRNGIIQMETNGIFCVLRVKHITEKSKKEKEKNQTKNMFHWNSHDNADKDAMKCIAQDYTSENH